MFDWFLTGGTGGSAGLEKMRAEFGQMLDAGRHTFDTASNAFLGGTELEVIRQDLFDTEKRINRAEQQIRREIVVHATVHGAAEFPPRLILMSIVKDAERIGDYAKNIFDLAEIIPHPPGGQHRENLVKLKDRILEMMAACREVFDAHSKSRASELLREAHDIQSFCEQQVSQLVGAEEPLDLAAAYALAYRYFKRISGHTSNVVSSVVQPLDKIDFPAKPEENAGAENSS